LKDAGESEALEILEEKLRMEFVRQGLDQALECGRVFCVERSVTAFEAGFATILRRPILINLTNLGFNTKYRIRLRTFIAPLDRIA